MNKRNVYTAEFKREAVSLTEQTGASVERIAKDLGVSPQTLHSWAKPAKTWHERILIKKFYFFAFYARLCLMTRIRK